MQDFMVDGVMYRCCEQYMMAQKARLFHDVEMEKKHYGCETAKANEGIWTTGKKF